MHYCVHVFTKEFPSMGMLEDIMTPYNEEDYYRMEYDEDGNERGLIERPDILWDCWVLGGRYGGNLHLWYDIEDKTSPYEWMYLKFNEPRNGRLFHCSLLYEMLDGNHNKYSKYEEKYFCYMKGDNYIHVDSAKISDLVNADDIICYCYIDTDGKAHARDHFNYDTLETIENENFDNEYKDYLKKCELDGGYVTVLDIHD